MTTTYTILTEDDIYTTVGRALYRNNLYHGQQVTCYRTTRTGFWRVESLNNRNQTVSYGSLPHVFLNNVSLFITPEGVTRYSGTLYLFNETTRIVDNVFIGNRILWNGQHHTLIPRTATFAQSLSAPRVDFISNVLLSREGAFRCAWTIAEPNSLARGSRTPLTCHVRD